MSGTDAVRHIHRLLHAIIQTHWRT